MDEITERVKEQIKNYVQDVDRYIPVKKAFLFGSYAKGIYKENSDIDIAIVSSNFNGKDPVDVNAQLLSYARLYKNICIEPIGFDEYEFDQNPFMQEILSTGKEIELS